MKKLAISIILLSCLVGCSSNDFRAVPPGYIGKVLTPTGYEDKIYEAGQVDIKPVSSVGTYNQLILCEATSTTVKEEFNLVEGNDHRVITKDGIPFVADVRVQVMIPNDKRLRDSIFTQITPTPSEGQERTSTIYLSTIYSQFAKAPIRNRIRAIFLKYDNFQEITSNYDKVNLEISQMIARTFEETKVPLQLVSGEISNVKPDPSIVEAQNRNAAAISQVETIQKISKAMRENPEYLEKYKWEVIEKSAGKGSTIIVNAGDSKVNYNLPLK